MNMVFHENLLIIVKFSKYKKNQIDYVAVATLNLPPKYFTVKRNTTFNIDDYLKEQNEYWFQKIYRKKNQNI